MNERLRELRLSLGITQSEFGRKLGVSRDVIAGIEYGKNKPNESLVKLASNLFGVREEWIRTGEGPQYELPEDPNMAYVDLLINEVNNPFYGMIRNIMKCYIELDDKGREIIEQFAKDLIKKE